MLKQISLAALLVAATFAMPAVAAGMSQGSGNQCQGNSCGGLGGGGGNKGAPGPAAGVGLPFLLLAGGYVLVRRYRAHHRAE